MKRCILLLIVFAALYLAGQTLYHAAYPDPGGVILYRPANGPDVAEFARLYRTARGNVSAWAQERSVTVVNKGNGGSLTADALYLYGLPEDTEAVEGELPSFAYANLCALDEQTALRLFGSLDIIGQNVTVAGTELTVVCVFRPNRLAAWFDTGDGLILCPAAIKGDSLRFQAVDFRIPAGGDLPPAEQAAQWIQDAGISGLSSPAALETQSHAAAFIAYLPMPAACFILLLSLIRPRYPAVLRVSGIIVLSALLITGLIPVRMPPPEWLPSRWSDAGFYPNLFASFIKDLAAGLMAGTLRPDLPRKALTAAGMTLSLLSIPFFMLYQSHINRMLKEDAP